MVIKNKLTGRKNMSQAKLFPEDKAQKKFLNVGGGSKDTIIPKCYENWQHTLLDIDPEVKPDIVCDARKLNTLESDQYDAIYCSHNLEHYFRHDALSVLKGFVHVLKDDGFAHIIVPNIQYIMQVAVANNLDLGDVLYQSGQGPITVRDVMYGYEKQIAESGQDYYAHKTGFSPKSLNILLQEAGFKYIGIIENKPGFEIIGVGFKEKITEEAKKIFNIKLPEQN